MKKLLICLLCACLMGSSAGALEIDDDIFDLWYEEMTWLADGIGARMVGTDGEDAALAYLRGRFESMNYSLEDGTLLETSCTTPWSEEESISLTAIKKAANPNPQILTVCAHYDSAPHGRGARDNASGVAAVLTMCELFSQRDPFPDTEIRFIAFSAEESGHQGSTGYCEQLTADERARSLATINIDILVADVWEDTLALSCDTLGMRTPDGYVDGSADAPAFNRAALAILAAMDEVGAYPPEDEEVYWCGPRHLGASDHESFHLVGIDSVNFCFRGTTESGGRWPEFMHTISDLMGDFDLDRSWNALSVLYTAMDGLATNHAYGD